MPRRAALPSAVRPAAAWLAAAWLAAACLAAHSPARADDAAATDAAVGGGIEVEAGADVVSAYVWRGLTLRPGPAAQPWLGGGTSWLWVGAWADLGLSDCAGCARAGRVDEVDLSLELVAPIEALDLAVGWVEYLLPGDPGASTREVYASAGAGWDLFTASLAAYYDLGVVDDVYLDLALGLSAPLAEDLTLDALARAGWAGPRMAAGGRAGMHDGELRLTLSYQLTEAVALHGYGAAAPSLDPRVLPPQDRPLHGGGGLVAGF